MRVINLNPDTDIGASAWFVDIDNHRILMDEGVHPIRFAQQFGNTAAAEVTMGPSPLHSKTTK